MHPEIVRGSRETVRANIIFMRESCESLAEYMRERLEKDERNLTLHNILSQTAIQLRRVEEWFDGPADLIAWPTRNLFELNLSLRYALESDASLRHYMSLMATDEIEILKGVLELAEDPTSKDAQVLRRRIEAVKQIVEKHGLRLRKGLSVSQLAKRAHVTRAYRAFFKLYSKYVHPSSFLVNATPERRDEFKDAFLVEVQRYAADTFFRVSEAVGWSPREADPGSTADHVG
jgi:hypothetical protein